MAKVTVSKTTKQAKEAKEQPKKKPVKTDCESKGTCKTKGRKAK